MTNSWQPHPIAAMASALIAHGVGLDSEPADDVIAARTLLHEGYSATEIAVYLTKAIAAARTFARTHLHVRDERPRPALRLVIAEVPFHA